MVGGLFSSGGSSAPSVVPRGSSTLEGTNAFRYMSQGELTAIKETGLLRGGRAGKTFFTKDLYKSATKAQQRLALPEIPTLRVEFQFRGNPMLQRNGTRVTPNFGQPGLGNEFMTTQPVKVDIINFQPLRPQF